MYVRRILMAVLAAGAAGAVLPAVASADINLTAPPLAAAPLPTAATKVAAPMNLACNSTPALRAALAASTTVSVANVNALCARYGTPAPSSGGPVRDSPAVCGNAGCAYIYLANEGGGWGWTDYYAEPCCARITGGALAGHQYTKNANVNYFWSETVVNNDGGYFHGYRQLWAHGGGTWVEVDVQGWSSLSNGGVATIGPVETWNYITR